MSDLLAHLRAELALEEERRLLPYDDATGKTLVPGMTLKGNITISIGVNLSDGVDDEEADWLFAHRVQKAIDALCAYAWYHTQDIVRQAVLVDLTFNLGIDGLLHWPHFLAAMARADYKAAYAEIESNTVWDAEVGPRAQRLEQMVLTGQWPADVPVGNNS